MLSTCLNGIPEVRMCRFTGFLRQDGDRSLPMYLIRREGTGMPRCKTFQETATTTDFLTKLLISLLG
jgi:hypothetical protein